MNVLKIPQCVIVMLGVQTLRVATIVCVMMDTLAMEPCALVCFHAKNDMYDVIYTKWP